MIFDSYLTLSLIANQSFIPNGTFSFPFHYISPNSDPHLSRTELLWYPLGWVPQLCLLSSLICLIILLIRLVFVKWHINFASLLVNTLQPEFHTHVPMGAGDAYAWGRPSNGLCILCSSNILQVYREICSVPFSWNPGTSWSRFHFLIW